MHWHKWRKLSYKHRICIKCGQMQINQMFEGWQNWNDIAEGGAKTFFQSALESNEAVKYLEKIDEEHKCFDAVERQKALIEIEKRSVRSVE